MKTNLDGSLPSFYWLPFIDIEGIIIRGYNPDALKGAVEKRRNLLICLNSIRKGYHLACQIPSKITLRIINPLIFLKKISTRVSFVLI
jgi:hypothetical protein